MTTIEQADERERLLRKGRTLFAIVGNELNGLSTREKESHRREIDHEEICIALALLMETMGIDVGDGR